MKKLSELSESFSFNIKIIQINIKIMITTAIIATIGGSLLFASQHYSIQTDHKNIQNVVSILEVPTKTETKTHTNTKNPENKEEENVENINQVITTYTNNLSEERVENMVYLIRDDGWIPYYLEPINDNNIYSPAFYGEISTQYNLEFDTKITNVSQLKLKLENYLGVDLKNIVLSGSSGVMIEIDQKLSAHEVEYIKTSISQFEDVIWSDINSGVLPEYQTDYYMNIINNSLIPE